MSTGLFSLFHVFFAPGGPHLGPLQCQLLADIVREHGGRVESSALALPSVCRSLSRRGRKHLVIVTGRDHIDNVCSDVLAAAARESAESSVVELERLFVKEDAHAICSVVRHEWVSHAVVGASNARESCSSIAHGATTTPSASTPMSISEQYIVAWSGAATENVAAPPSVKEYDIKQQEEPGAKQGKAAPPSRVREAEGFLPIFFSDAVGGAVRRTSTNSASASDVGLFTATMLDAVHRVKKFRRSHSRENGRSSTSDDSDDSHSPALRRQQQERPVNTEDHTHMEESHHDWVAPSPCALEQPVVSGSVIGPLHAPSLSRQAKRIDALKPFVCQRLPTADTSAPVFAASAALMMDEDELPPTSHGSYVSSSPAVSLNQPLLTQLAQLKEVYRATGDQWRTYAYNKAIGVIKRVPFQVERVEQLQSYKGIGDRILNKVREILESGSTTKLQLLKTSPQVQAMEALTKIWGVGPSTARRLAHHIIPSARDPIAALRSAENIGDLLTPVQLAGLRHYEELQQRIPREEVTLMVAYVRRAVAELVGRERAQQVDVIACGSYRRGKPTSGDVDILLCDRNSTSEDGLLASLVQRLKRPFVKDDSLFCESFVQDQQQQRNRSTQCKKLAVKDEPLSVPSMQDTFPTRHQRLGQLPMKRERDEELEVSSLVQNPSRADPHFIAPRTVLPAAERFAVEDLTVSHRGMEETHSDMWFGIVQLPDFCRCEPVFLSDMMDAQAVPHCPCSHRHQQDAEALLAPSGPGDAHSTGVHLCRRLDIKVYPPQQFPFALLYFTGSDYFNRSMRLYCQKKGWSLSDKELKPVIRVHGEKVHETAHGIQCRTEEDIFEAVGLPYKSPSERDV